MEFRRRPDLYSGRPSPSLPQARKLSSDAEGDRQRRSHSEPNFTCENHRLDDSFALPQHTTPFSGFIDPGSHRRSSLCVNRVVGYLPSDYAGAGETAPSGETIDCKMREEYCSVVDNSSNGFLSR